MAGAIELEGFKEFRGAVKKANGGTLPKELGQAHKEVGKFVIDHLQPKPIPSAVGAGAGAAVRASASKREVLLRVGGAYRPANFYQWGRKAVRPQSSGRPYIVETARANEDEIINMMLKSVNQALKDAGPFGK